MITLGPSGEFGVQVGPRLHCKLTEKGLGKPCLLKDVRTGCLGVLGGVCPGLEPGRHPNPVARAVHGRGHVCRVVLAGLVGQPCPEAALAASPARE